MKSADIRAAEWSEIPFWAAFRRVKRTGFPEKELLSVYRDFGVVRKRDRDDNFNVESEDLTPYQLVRKGDLAINKMKAWQGSLGVSPYEGIVSPAYFVFEPRSSNNIQFLNHLLRSKKFAGLFRAVSKGIRPNQWDLDPDQLRSIKLRLPPLDEQRAIADYLDQETAQIDALVAKQEEFIGLLRERRSAVRDRALTVGLKGGVRNQRTGNVWLPNLPSGWQAIPTRRLLADGPSNGVSPEAGRMGDMCSLSIGAVRDGRVKVNEDVTKYVDRDALRDVHRLLLQHGDVLIVRGNGNLDLVGRAGLVGKEFDQLEYIYPDLLIRIRTNSMMTSEFFVAAFESPASRAQLEQLARTTVGTFKVSAADIRSIVLPVPPLDEQRSIVGHIKQQTSRIDTLIVKAEEHISLAKERRSALITAAVTGQFDVRTARKA